ncbi:hypothetical protein Tco_0699934 [Tanacetum coccineum]
MAPKRRTTRLNPETTPAATATTTTTSVTNAQLQAMLTKALLPLWQHVMQTRMMLSATTQEQVLGETSEPLVSALT